MGKPEDFIIEDGVLVDYIGTDKAAVIPDGVEVIARMAFSPYAGIDESEYPGPNDIFSITSVYIPASVKKIESTAFGLCTFIETVRAESFEAWCEIDFVNAFSNPMNRARDVLGSITYQSLISAISGLPMGIGMLCIIPLCNRFGKRKVSIAGYFLTIAGGAVCLINPFSLAVILIGLAIRFAGNVPSNYVTNAFFADVGEHIEWKNGFRTDGLNGSFLNVMMTLGMGVGQSLFNLLLNIGHYDANLSEQLMSAKWSIIGADIIVPMVFGVFCCLIMYFFKIENRMPDDFYLENINAFIHFRISPLIKGVMKLTHNDFTSLAAKAMKLLKIDTNKFYKK